MSEFANNQMANARQSLALHLEKGSVKDPALFWAGLMSTYISRITMGSVFQLSDNLEMLSLIKNAYDDIIYNRTA